MTYLALARKFRPRRFEDVIGQPHVVQALGNALDRDRLHPALLLTGTRGVGKTTLARLIAKGLNCETGVTAKPCGDCDACRELDEGRFVDLLEIDAASHTGVDNVREVIDNAQYAPSRGRYKVYLIDEVHMLSKNAFNALLKTLEEPPPHVKFLMATTDPQRLPVTVLSRCLQFNLRRLPAALIRERLAVVLEAEGVTAAPAALAEIARSADGSLRDGLSLLDQAIAFGGGSQIEVEAVRDMLGTQGREVLFDLIGSVASGDGPQVLRCVNGLDARAPDYASLLNDLAAALQRMAVLQQLPEATDDEDDPALVELAGRIPAEDLQLYYQAAIGGRRDLAWAPDPRLGFEMTVLRMLAFRPGDSVPGGAAAGGGAGAGAGRRPPPQATGTASGQWARRVETMDLDGYERQLARHCSWLGDAAGTVTLQLDPDMKHLLTEARRAAIERALSSSGTAVRLIIQCDDAEPLDSTPARQQAEATRQHQARAEASIASDPKVAALRERFGATVRTGSVRPVNGGGEAQEDGA